MNIYSMPKEFGKNVETSFLFCMHYFETKSGGREKQTRWHKEIYYRSRYENLTKSIKLRCLSAMFDYRSGLWSAGYLIGELSFALVGITG